TFDPVVLNLQLNKPSRYLLHTHGCTTNYKRIVTSFYESQDLDFVTTLISNILNSESGNSVSTATPDAIKNLYSAIATSAGTAEVYDDIYDMIDQTPALAGMFENTF